jgi:hypothetical protein
MTNIFSQAAGGMIESLNGHPGRGYPAEDASVNSPEAGHAGLDVETMDERLGIDSLPLCMSLPSFVRPHRGRAASGLNDFRFQAFCRPFAHSRRNGRFVRMHAENAQRVR